ncbi:MULTISPECIES: glutamine synthetase family protein [Metallosphaera]|uniref:Glutamine synthetase n=2 Tax=Metallosphaera TaxID=41980 RepID=A0A0K1SGI9_9CREN|nr:MULTISPECIES: glutamine synthetase family protein [Metallosphaera]AKV73718.1 glutamine synthetase [Metallosphaera sedula]AKV75958.1 glutamine synthetase [Metallosphaera sedula]AKV78209.1 glutamine synthetase [Metallosphaera sedula]AKV80454.1 glutamine synthetase [Metallosphaera sedula]AKV82702.1 glutamine synthetase [Metallosphaera sedula]
MSRTDLIETLKSGRVDYVRVEFIDILGHVRGRSLRRAEFERVMAQDLGVPYAESLVMLDFQDRPLKSRYEDMIAVPDPQSFVIIPYLERTARVLSFLFSPDGSPLPFCTRSLLQRAVNKLEEHGLRLETSFEPTFYLLKNNQGNWETADMGKAFSPEGLMDQQDFLKDVIKHLEMVGVQVEMINKHYGPGQYEITFSSADVMSASDYLITAREVIRDVAKLHGKMATFMPKPFANTPGSSMDIYLKLVKSDGSDAMLDPNDPKGVGLSRTAYAFFGGILEHLGSILAIASPTINSYKRFKELVTPNLGGMGSERHFLLRIPSNIKEQKAIEFRLADPLTNSYLLLSAIIMAGIEGIEKNLDAEVNNVVKSIPRDLREALSNLESDTSLKYSLGEELIRAFLDLKTREIDEYESFVTQWERDAYLKAGW